MHPSTVALPVVPSEGIGTLAEEIGLALELNATLEGAKEPIREAMARALAKDDLVPGEILIPVFKTYRHEVLYVDLGGRFSIAALVWLPGQQTPVHDHRCWCCFGVWRGRELERHYRADENGQLAESGKSICYCGDVEFLTPPGDIHQVVNDDLHPTVSIHVYGADLRVSGTSILNCYDSSGHLPPGSANREKVIGIVGGGFSGTMTAVHLLRQHGQGVRVVLFEATQEPGRGAAYGTRCESHLLNVPAAGMSAFADQPQHFLEWCHAQGREAAPADFLPRIWYGEYLSSVLADEAGRSSATFEVRGLRVDGIQEEPGGKLSLFTQDGGEVAVDAAILAVGSPPGRQHLQQARSMMEWPAMIDPWQPGSMEDVQREDSVLVVGMGLTFMDVACELNGRGFQGRITAISRRGLLPSSHQTSAGAPFNAADFQERLLQVPMTARCLCRFFRSEVAVASRSGSDWRDVANAVRPWTSGIWAALPSPERKRFSRHLKPYWEVIRHRVAPATQEAVSTLINEGRLGFSRGALSQLSRTEDGRYQAIWQHPQRGRCEQSFDRVVNATGFGVRLANSSCPLLSQLRSRGWLREDDLGLGFDTASDFRLVDTQGKVVPRVYYVGPMLRARFWECTAVPELRLRAKEIAACVQMDLATSDLVWA